MSSAAQVLTLALTLVLAACGGKHAASPRPAPPALFASIPADTPYVIASFEAVPLDVLAMYRDAFGAVLRGALESDDDEDDEDDEDDDDEDGGGGGEAEDPAGDDDFDRLVAALFAELDGKWTAAGMESLGFSATPRFAIYGLGLYPVVRLEIRDGKRLLATIDRIARRAQLSLPQPETQGGRTFWQIVEGEHAVVIAITADQLVLAYASPAELEASLPLVLGTRHPARNMADGAALAGARAKHRLGGHAIALVDTRQLASRLVTAAQPAPACTAAVDRLAARVPRLVGGYAIGPVEHEVAMVLELAPDLLGELRALRVELPAVAEAAADRPLLMMAGGIDLPRAQTLAVSAAEAIGRVAAVCGAPSESAGEAAHALASPLPPALARLRGGVLSIRTLTLSQGLLPLPTEREGFALASSPDAAARLALARAAVSRLLPLDFGADGKLHRIPQDQLPLSLPFELFAGASQRAIVVGAGAQGRRLAERALAARPAPAPFFASDGDYGRVSALQAQTSRGRDRELYAARARIYGRLRMTLDASDRGLELRVGFETKPSGR